MDQDLAAFLVRQGLAEDLSRVRVEALTGGVASDIWHVTTDTRDFVVKRALARLRVAQEWHVSTARNAAEVAWLREAARFAPTCVPAVLAHEAEAGLFAMPYLDPARYPVWKALLRDGVVDPRVAGHLGAALATIHAGTAGRAEIAARFDNAVTFHAIRIEPYLLATARLHADLAPILSAIAERAESVRLALVHGDVSPKNILVGPDGPVLLDAECANYGDPAFDLAFCLNHLLLKSVWAPEFISGFAACFDALAHHYLSRVTWEPADALEARAAGLLPALLLARIDGKSPVEYLTRSEDRGQVRAIARKLLRDTPSRLAVIARLAFVIRQ